MSQKTFECRWLGPIRFQNVHPLNICLTSKKSDRQMVRGLGRMAGGVVVPSAFCLEGHSRCIGRETTLQ